MLGSPLRNGIAEAYKVGNKIGAKCSLTNSSLRITRNPCFVGSTKLIALKSFF